MSIPARLDIGKTSDAVMLKEGANPIVQHLKQENLIWQKEEILNNRTSEKCLRIFTFRMTMGSMTVIR
jgi:hypothetical protein